MSAPIRNILIVDDRSPNREYLTSLLASRGYTTLEAVDGMDALEALRSHKADLVLADILMPRMDGYEFVRRLRQEPTLSSIPVILMTAHYLEAKARVLAESFGVSFVITKPVEPSVILDSVARALEQGPRAERQVSGITGHARSIHNADTSHLTPDTSAGGSHPTPDAYAEQHRRLLTDTLAYKAEQLEAANARLRGLVSLGRRLASERSPRQLLSLFVSAAGDLVGAAYVLIAIPDLPKWQDSAQAVTNAQEEAGATGRSFRHIVANGRDPAIVGRISSGGAVHELFKSNEALGQSAVALDPLADHELLLPEEFRALNPRVVIAPIATASQHYGLLVFGGVNLSGEPADSIESLAQSMGAVLAVAYENALRYEQIEHHAGRLQDEIAERRVAEDRIARLNAELEERVAERTAELQRSHERLRQSERMASLGTLCAGLGHDMGNLLLPIRVRLDLLESSVKQATSADLHETKPDQFLEHVNSIRECIKYISDLTSGLRLLSLDADAGDGRREATNLRQWWTRVKPLLRSALSARIELDSLLPDEEVVVALSEPRLTQAIFNLIQNAGDALRSIEEERADPLRVTVKVEGTADAQDDGLREWIELSVIDNGPGMPEEVRRRALEPYFTTKSRRLSTGLGLALVHGITLGANGRVDIDSAPGNGTTVRLLLPRVQCASPRDERRPGAVVSVADARLRSTVVSMMKLLGFQVHEHSHDMEVDIGKVASNEVWITEHRAPPETIESFLESGTSRRVGLIGAHSMPAHPRCVELGTTAKEVRAELRRQFAPQRRGAVAADTSRIGS